MTDAEILAAIRAALEGGDPGPVVPPSDTPMLDKIDGGELVFEVMRYFESVWRYWMYPKVEAKYLVKFCHNFITIFEREDYATRFGYPPGFFPKAELVEFKQALQAMAMERWQLDLTKNQDPRGQAGGGVPPISLPDVG